MRRLLALFLLPLALAGCDARAPEKVDTSTMGAAPAPPPAPTPEAANTRIVQHIKQQLSADPELGRFVIDVDSKEGLVVISGVAPSEAARRRASEIARDTPQVHDVSNQLQVKAG
jgi:hyperosmotically inducible periplasmic protein